MALLSCEDSDDFGIPLALLHHDGNNGSAPILNAGTNHVGVMFTGDQVAQYNQGNLSEIQFFMANIPESCQLDIYQGTENNHLPGTKIYSADVTSEIAARTWNRHVLDQELTVDREDLWVTLTFTHPLSAGLIGCDLGPQVANGALILNASETSWQAYTLANINWNIRAGFIE
jgi:hypothetical protein